MNLSFRLTYTINTKESVDLGLTYDHGFCDTYGTPITSEIEEGFPNCRDVPDSEVELYDPNDPDIEYTLQAAINLGCYLEKRQNDSSAYSDFTVNFQTGDETGYGFHFKTDDWVLNEHIRNCLVEQRVTELASEYFEKIQTQPKQGELL